MLYIHAGLWTTTLKTQPPTTTLMAGLNPFETGEDHYEPTRVQHPRRRGSLPQLFIDSAASLESRPWSAVDGQGQDALPLSGSGETKRKGKGKGSKRWGRIFKSMQFGKHKTSKATSPTSKALLTGHGEGEGDGSGPHSPSLEDPFGDQHAMECEDDGEWAAWVGRRGSEDVDMAGSSPTRGDTQTGPGRSSISDASLSQWAVCPRTPQKKQSSSTPTTPRSSPWSRSSLRTPGSARSARSVRSALSQMSDKSRLSATSSMLKKHAKRKKERNARMASQMKSIQILGAEAVGAVAKATRVPEDELQVRVFGRMVDNHIKDGEEM